MMALASTRPHLIDRLPRPRGRLTADAPLGPQTWFRAGGPAEVLFRPADADDLAAFLAALPPEVPVMVLGVGSNLLVRDGGVRGVVIRLMRGFTEVAVEGAEVRAGAGALDLNVALTACAQRRATGSPSPAASPRSTARARSRSRAAGPAARPSSTRRATRPGS